MVRNEKVEVNLKHIFKDWSHYLNVLLTSKYIINLISFINHVYKVKHIFPINKESLFRPFQLLSFYKVRVVIIGKEPYHSKVNTGIPFAQEDCIFELEKGLSNIEKCIERTQYDKFNLYMDTKLTEWLEQGVLPLYSSLTVEKDKPGSHLIYWRNFIREVVKAISLNRNGIIFILWGEEGQYFKQFINKDKHYILEYSLPDSVDKDWNCTNFSECNSIIKDNNGEEFCIKW